MRIKFKQLVFGARCLAILSVVFLTNCRSISGSFIPTPEMPASVDSNTSVPTPTLMMNDITSTPVPGSSPVEIDATDTSEFYQLPGPGWIELAPRSSEEPPTRLYQCPWIDLSPQIPEYTYRVIKTFPHDPAAYTQGLVYQGGRLFESTGLHGQSSLRQLDLESGEIIQEQALPEQYFGEGLALHDGILFQLTWQEQTAFLYESETLDLVGSFTYAEEGWGLTGDGRSIIMSDGTDSLYFRSPGSFKIHSTLPVMSSQQPVSGLNELEYVDGEIWANIYQSSCIARIDPGSGNVVGWIDISGLLSAEEIRTANVPNGIAYETSSKRLLVTGKLWPWIFEIDVVPTSGN